MNPQWGGVGPGGAGRQFRVRVGVEREMPRRIEGEGGARQPMRLAIVGTGGEPAGEQAEIGRAIAAAAAPLVEGCDRSQELRDGGPCPRPQQFSLRRLVAGVEEPAAQTPPALAPGLQGAVARIGLVLRTAGSRIARFAFGHLAQQGVNARFQDGYEARDGVGAAHQIAHEAFQIVDQPLLVARDRARLRLLQFDAARDSGHEGLRVLGKAFEYAHEVPQRFVDLGDIGLVRPGQCLKGLQSARYVFERHRL